LNEPRRALDQMFEVVEDEETKLLRQIIDEHI
jgi:hypothetical protein